MRITQEQIEKYFDNECTKEEAETIAQYLQDNPGVLRNYVARDWQQAAATPELPAVQREAMLAAIRKEIFPLPESSRVRTMSRKWVVRAAVAAMVIGACAQVWFLSLKNGAPTVNPASGTAVRNSLPDTVSTAYRIRVNKGREEQTIVLPDGSVASLAAGSTLRYPDPFTGNTRAILLEGTSTFKVMKQKGHPFTVSAGPVLTTVLGTEFRVIQTSGGVTVKLYSGKVRLQAKDSMLKGWREDIILLPGEQMKYDAGRDLVAVSGFEKIVTPAVGKAQKIDDEALVFAHRPLAEVMDRLAARYHTHIAYDRRLVGGMYFTGTVLGTDSLPSILQLITNMNDLEIVEGTNGFIIQKNIP